MKNIDINAPIIPYEGMGGIKLYSTIKDLDLSISEEGVKAEIWHNRWGVYEIEKKVILFYHLYNGKLFKITTLEDYKGKLFSSIDIDTTEEEFLKIEPSFMYEDFEEIFVSPNGIFIETDPITTKAMWISIFVKEIDR